MINCKKYLALTTLLIPIQSYATLGESTSSIVTDRQALSASSSLLRSSQSQTQTDKYYQITTLKTDNNVTVKEYSSNNKVFAIKWQGPTYPNFKQIFGKYTPQLKTAKQNIQELNSSQLSGQDFVFHASGLPGRLSGTAYVPSLVPAEIDINSLK